VHRTVAPSAYFSDQAFQILGECLSHFGSGHSVTNSRLFSVRLKKLCSFITCSGAFCCLPSSLPTISPLSVWEASDFCLKNTLWDALTRFSAPTANHLLKHRHFDTHGHGGMETCFCACLCYVYNATVRPNGSQIAREAERQTPGCQECLYMGNDRLFSYLMVKQVTKLTVLFWVVREFLRCRNVKKPLGLTTWYCCD